MLRELLKRQNAAFLLLFRVCYVFCMCI